MRPRSPRDESVRTRGSSKVARARRYAAVAQLAARQFGVVSLEDLRDCGLSKAEVARQVRDSALHRLHRGVYACGHPNVPLEGRFLAAVKACGARAVLSHFAAAALWGLSEWNDRLVDVTVVGARAPRHPGLRTHRTRSLEAAAEVTSRDGIPVTSPARTLVDLAPYMRERELRRAVRQGQSLGLVRLEELAATLARAGRRRGRRKLTRIIAAGPAPTRGVLEDVVLELIESAGFERPVVNGPLILDGRTLVPDFRWPEEQLVVEADGAAWHDHKLAREADAERQAILEAHGERVVRVTWEQAVSRPAETIARLRAAGAPSKGH